MPAPPPPGTVTPLTDEQSALAASHVHRIEGIARYCTHDRPWLEDEAISLGYVILVETARDIVCEPKRFPSYLYRRIRWATVRMQFWAAGTYEDGGWHQERNFFDRFSDDDLLDPVDYRDDGTTAAVYLDRVDAVGVAVKGLPHEERAVVRMRYGLDGKGERSPSEVARVMLGRRGDRTGVGARWAGRVEAKAIERLRTALEPRPSDEEKILDAIRELEGENGVATNGHPIDDTSDIYSVWGIDGVPCLLRKGAARPSPEIGQMPPFRPHELSARFEATTWAAAKAEYGRRFPPPSNGKAKQDRPVCHPAGTLFLIRCECDPMVDRDPPEVPTRFLASLSNGAGLIYTTDAAKATRFSTAADARCYIEGELSRYRDKGWTFAVDPMVPKGEEAIVAGRTVAE